MRLNFAVFTRECEPYLKVNYSNREYIEPKGDSVFFVDVGLKAVKQEKSAVSMHYFSYVKHFALKYPHYSQSLTHGIGKNTYRMLMTQLNC